MLLTKTTTPIIGQVATVLGLIMNAIYEFCDKLFNIQSIGLSIILFTIIIYMLLLPLTIKQQKFSKLSAKMNPELQAINKKYKGKQDQTSMMKMQEETKAVYAKYGVSPSGSCLQMLIQMPVLFALYRVIWNMPAYVSSIRDIYSQLVEKLMSNSAAQEFLTTIAEKNAVNFEKLGYTQNSIIDVLYKFKTEDWASLVEKFPDMTDLINSTQQNVNHINNFLGMNIADSPMAMLQSGFAAGSIILIIAALIIPVLAGLTQWFNMKLMPQANTNQSSDGQDGTMASTMKTMNNVMPIMSVVFCFSLPAGMGLYWIAGSVIRSIQQIIVNKQMDKIDIDELVKKNIEKENEKRAKMGLPPQKITNQAKVNVKNIKAPEKPQISEEERNKMIQNSTEYYNSQSEAKPGSIAAKAQMVKKYNEKHKK